MNVSKLEILIVEDDYSFSIELEMMINQLGYKSKIIDNSEEAISYIKNKIPDLVLMDIDIKGDLNGVEVAEAISYLKIPVLFISNLKEQEEKVLSNNIPSIGFIKKPIEEKSLSQLIDTALKTIALSKVSTESKEEAQEYILSDRLYLKKNNLLHKVMLKDILYILANGDYCKIQSIENTFVLKCTLSKIQKHLEKNSFTRIHKSHLINMEHIKNIALSKNELLMGDETTLAIGRAFKEDLMRQLDTLG